MFHRILAATAIAAAFVAAPTPANDLGFTLVNGTGQTISEVYVSPHSSNNWEEDLMGEDRLDDGTNVRIMFTATRDTCRWDLKVVYGTGDVAIWQNGFDLCSVSTITLQHNPETGATTATSS